MSQLNHIGDFFRKRLISQDVAEEQWNVPSDDVWEKALPHLPKEKKRDRMWIFFFLIPLLIVCSVFFYQYGEGETCSPTLSLKDEPSSLVGQAAIHDKEDTTTEQNVQQTTESEDVNKRISVSAAKAGSSQIEVIDQPDTNSLRLHPLAVIDRPDPEPVSQAIGSDPIATDGEKTDAADQNNESIVNASQPSNYELSSVNPHVEKLKNQSSPVTLNDYVDTSFAIVSEGAGLHKSSAVINEYERATESSHVKTPALPSVPVLKMNSEFDIFTGLAVVDIAHERRGARIHWEAGMAYSRYISPTEWIIDEINEGDEDYMLAQSQWGYDLSLTSFLNHRWSISSGVYFSELSFKLDFAESSIFGENNGLEQIKKRVEDIASIGRVSLNGDSREIEIDYLQNLNIQSGQQVDIKLGIPLRLDSYQLPLLVNYHIGYRRFEWIVSAGISVDFVRVGIENVDVQVTSDNESIIEPVIYQPISVRLIDGSLYGGVGLRYALSHHLHLGMNTRIDIGEPRLSKIDTGLFYRF